MKGLKIFASCMIVLSSSAIADEDYEALARLGYAYWDCASYGYLMKSPPSSAELLFTIGSDTLGEFLQAGLDGKLTEQNTKNVPIGLSWYYIQGPSLDFSLGYMWAKFSENTHDETWPVFETPSFKDQKQLQTLHAAQGYQDKNCELLAQ